MNRNILFAAILTLFATGCAKQHVALTPENAQKVSSSAVILVVEQEEIEAEVEQSNAATAMGGGLIPALIDVAVESYRSKSAEEQISPLRSYLADIDFRKKLELAIEQKMADSWLKVTHIEITPALSRDEMKHMFENRDENALLTVTAEYKLAPDFKVLKTSSINELLVKGEKEAIYKNNLIITSPEMMAKTEDEAVAQWSGNEGEKLRQAMLRGIDELADKIAKDLALRSNVSAASEQASAIIN